MQIFEILTTTILLLGLYTLILIRWERGLYWLVAYLPFAGAVSLALKLWWPSLLFKDICLVLPLYLAFLARVAIHRESPTLSSPIVVYLMLCLAALVIVQADNYGVANPMMALIGIKVWLFYLPLCFVAYAFVDSPERLIKMLRLIVALSFIPAIVALLQLYLVRHLGYHAAMQVSYGENALSVTQGYTQFKVGQGSISRIASIFTFPTQFFGYSLVMMTPAYILWRTDPSPLWRRTGIWALVVAAFATILSGAREAYIFTPLTLAFTFGLDRGVFGMIAAASRAFFIVWIGICVFVGATFWAMYGFIQPLFSSYARDLAYGGLVKAIHLAPLGMGTGTSTGAARYALSDRSSFLAIENYYAKVVVELGIPGLSVVIALFLAIAVVGFKARGTMTFAAFRTCSSAFLAFVIVMFLNSFKGWQIDLDPINVYYWLFVGFLLKLPVLEHNRLTEESK
jgi:hypothetical protein